ncbi:extracellular solute-binding protein [Cohnella faecalis]|uniref:Extracellular solute-binding protein n=1 Tax=Cohnella faecalis TaxID=2315694 RepID=A0A398CR26_9BACL|nr:extracellular solute-binding protein [Cohnella faecalis]RIE01881.1 extracellular solute-binding protein [Cohnella faecalis]
MNKRTITLAISIALVFSLILAACSSKNSDNKASPSSKATMTQEASPPASTSTPEPSPTGFEFHKYDTPIQLTFHTLVGADSKWRDGESFENNAFTRWAKDELGIEWKTKFLSPTFDDSKTKLNLGMASNELPDAIFSDTAQLGVLAGQGYLAPLNELIEKYGSPLVKDRLKAAMEASGGKFLSPYTIDGKYYALPIDVEMWGRTYYNTFIRQDILDSLGKQVPQTLEQFEDVLAAYKAKVPDGIGVFLHKDLVPDGVNQMSPAMQPYNAYPGRWVVGADGKLAYGSIQPETKKGLETLNKWFKNGWLDKEFIMKDFNKALEQVVAGKVLSITGDWWYAYYPLPDVVKNVETAKFSATSLQGPDGKARLVTTNPFSLAIGISSKSEHPEAFIYQLNEMMDSALRQDSALRDRMKNEYGYEFKYPVESANSQIAKNPEAPQEQQDFDVVKPGPMFFRTSIKTKFFGGFQWVGDVDKGLNDLVAVANAVDKGNKDGLSLSQQQMLNDLTNNKTIDALVSEVHQAQSIRSDMVIDGFTGAPTPTMIEKGAYLKKLENEIFAKIIFGSKPIDDFDKFVSDWKKAGGDQITQEVNDWYAKSK